VVFVTHSITEAAFLSSRVIVMAARPGRVVDDIAVSSPYPRDDLYRTTPEFNALVRRLHDALTDASQLGSATGPLTTKAAA